MNERDQVIRRVAIHALHPDIHKPHPDRCIPGSTDKKSMIKNRDRRQNKHEERGQHAKGNHPDQRCGNGRSNGNNRDAEMYDLYVSSRRFTNEWRIVKRHWWLEHVQVTPVKRSQEWFDNSLPLLHKAWQDVNLYKQNGIRELPPDPSIDPKFHTSLYKKYLRYTQQQALKTKFMFVLDSSDPKYFSVPP